MKQTSTPFLKLLGAAYLSIWEVAVIALPFQLAWNQLVPENLRGPRSWLSITALLIYAYLAFVTTRRYGDPQFKIRDVASPFPGVALFLLGGLILYSMVWLIGKQGYVGSSSSQFVLVWGIAAILYTLHPRFISRLFK